MLNAKEARLQTEQNIATWHKEQEDKVAPFIEYINKEIDKAILNRQFSVLVTFPDNTFFLKDDNVRKYQENYISNFYQKLKYRAHFIGNKFSVSWDDESSQLSIR
jgi:hypothetical protein